MLIIYRTNVGFEGEIVSLDYMTPAAAMDVYLATEPVPELGVIEIAERGLEPAVLGALVASVSGYGQSGRFYVADVNGTQALVDGGV